ncbi:DUF6776 family protein [Methylophaga sp. OBS3]|uniref:DUF6776 family protein n=1 Tax=Methylophaga sp. OBS3 TaxID=2991934 RepID=UPI00224DA157|nr:DUF6776 family protein [Methylophaga sp. OBS3]MCX4189874.1 hypothetical protein [Methylophaga sp. OBS3]
MWIVLVVFITGLAQWYYHRYISAQQAELVAENSRLKQELDEIRPQFQALSQTQTSQQQLEAIHQVATNQLETRLQQLQQKIIDLNKELLFYQTVTQGSGSSELQVREVQLRAEGNEANHLRYRIVLTQGDNISEPLTGHVAVSLLPNTEKPDNTDVIGEHGLNLRFVQVIEGTFSPSETPPAQLVVTITQKNKPLITRAFNWQEIMPNEP